MRGLQKVKILGYPFAGGQGKCGVELTPSWLQSQKWFKDLTRQSKGLIQYEEIQVSCSDSNMKNPLKAETNGQLEPKNFGNVLNSSFALKKQTYNALQEGFYPIVLGGDHSQAIGSIAGLKQMYSDAKILWIDAHIDANTPDSSPSLNAHGMPLAYLTGMIPRHMYWKCVDMKKDICYFGIRSYEPEEHQLIKDKEVMVFEASECLEQNLTDIERKLQNYFRSKNPKYWVSFDIDGVDAKCFRSTGTAEEEGISLEFIESFFEKFAHKTVGMDFTEVNFELAPTQLDKMVDQNTFRHLLELICHSVNSPQIHEDESSVSQFYEPQIQLFQKGMQSPPRGFNSFNRAFSAQNKKN